MDELNVSLPADVMPVRSRGGAGGTGALLRKEWNEHRWFLLGLYVLGAIVLGGTWHKAADSVTPLSALVFPVSYYGPLAAVLLANRIVMREYGAGTQLFLEALPVGRGRVLAAKWLFGWMALLLFFGAALGLVLFGSRERVFLAGGLPAAIALRATVFLLAVYAAAFAVALTLRLRFVVAGVLLLLGMLMSFRLQLSPGEWVPFVLAGDGLVQDAALPGRQLALGAGLAIVCTAVSMLLALAARGALPVVLARPLSARARTLVAFALAGCAALITLFGERTEVPPFHLEGAISSRGEPSVHVGWRDDVAGVAPARLAQDVASDLAHLRDWLGMDAPTQVSIVPDAWREPDDIAPDFGYANHLVVRAALGAPGLSLTHLHENVLASEIVDQSPILLYREDRWWLLAGFAAWWGGTHDEARRALLERRAAAAVRMLAARGLDGGTVLRASETAEEALGECLFGALAWRAVQALHDRLGQERFRALMRASLRGPHGDDARALAEVRSTDALLREAGMALPELARAVDGLPVPPTGSAAPALRVAVVREAGAMFALRYRVTGPLPPGLAVRYKLLGPTRPPMLAPRMQFAGGAATDIVPVTFASGARVLVTADAFAPDLQCNYRFGAVRMELP